MTEHDVKRTFCKHQEGCRTRRDLGTCLDLYWDLQPIPLTVHHPHLLFWSPLLYSLYTHDCTATSGNNITPKFADDTAVVGLISNNDERDYLQEISHLEDRCQLNNLQLNLSKTNELIVDVSTKQQRSYAPVVVGGGQVKRLASFKYLGVNLSEDLAWCAHINCPIRGYTTLALNGTSSSPPRC